MQSPFGKPETLLINHEDSRPTSDFFSLKPDCCLAVAAFDSSASQFKVQNLKTMNSRGELYKKAVRQRKKIQLLFAARKFIKKFITSK